MQDHKVLDINTSSIVIDLTCEWEEEEEEKGEKREKEGVRERLKEKEVGFCFTDDGERQKSSLVPRR